jgi:hypothetical protein
MRQPRRGGPGQNPRAGLVEPPARQVLEVVVPAAFRRQVARAGRSAQAVGDRVVLLAPPGRLTAGGEPACPVTGLDERAHRVRDPVTGARLLMGAATGYLGAATSRGPWPAGGERLRPGPQCRHENLRERAGTRQLLPSRPGRRVKQAGRNGERDPSYDAWPHVTAPTDRGGSWISVTGPGDRTPAADLGHGGRPSRPADHDHLPFAGRIRRRGQGKGACHPGGDRADPAQLAGLAAETGQSTTPTLSVAGEEPVREGARVAAEAGRVQSGITITSLTRSSRGPMARQSALYENNI